MDNNINDNLDHVIDENNILLNNSELYLETINDIFIEYLNKWNIDIKDIKPSQFTGACNYIANRFYKPNIFILRDKVLQSQELINNCGGKAVYNYNYNIDKVIKAYNVFKMLCNNYGFLLNITNFCEYIGCSNSMFYRWAGGLASAEATSAARLFLKQIGLDSESCLQNMMLERGRNPMQVLPILNHRHGWNLPNVSREDATPTLAADNLPDLSLPGAQNAALPDFNTGSANNND